MYEGYTFAVPKDVDRRDLGSWLGQGLVKYDGKKLIKVEAVDTSPERGIEIIGRNYQRDGKAGGLVNLERNKIECWWPRPGLLNCSTQFGHNAALYIQRRTRRDWKRTYTKDGVEFYWPLSYMWTHRDRHAGPANKDLMVALANRTYPSLKEARKLLDSGEAFTVALSPMLGVALSMCGGLVLFYRTRAQGVIKDGKYEPLYSGHITPHVTRLVEELL